MARPRILIIYTGGTIGMIRDADGALVPFTLEDMLRRIPSVTELGIDLHSIAVKEIVDSSNMSPQMWQELVGIIATHYKAFDGFVILHGSDTMAYTASALSFMLEGLAKPVILTGSQLPIGLARSDARENLITSLMLASMQEDSTPIIREVCIYFEDRLFRGNRTHKFNAENFDAFRSVNYPVLAEAGVHLKIHREHLLEVRNLPFRAIPDLSGSLASLRLYPGMDIMPYVDMFAARKIGGLILETYGAGNGPLDRTFLHGVRTIVDSGTLVLNVSQCRGGKVQMDKYATGRSLKDAGVLSGSDITFEAAITKMMHVLAMDLPRASSADALERPLCGELTL